jgi:hypothetical protein
MAGIEVADDTSPLLKIGIEYEHIEIALPAEQLVKVGSATHVPIANRIRGRDIGCGGTVLHVRIHRAQ